VHIVECNVLVVSKHIILPYVKVYGLIIFTTALIC